MLIYVKIYSNYYLKPKGGVTTMRTYLINPFNEGQRNKEDHDRELQKWEGCASP
ncbi:hypothetical protein GCM10008013_32080 [Paenibacillus segetis]|uniref:Uncharacterized protein n=1 Tax=Paenibacillus segetis TaxID=1325360 RepID=A0ABQ1YKG4_9BACL|nr:hypothetical protein GCM10008013_32080 [Paenibacillus segetis]